MEQFITLQRCRETEGGRERERERERERKPAAFFYNDTRRVRVFLFSRHCSRIVELLFCNLRFVSGDDCAHVTIGKTGYQ